MSDAGSNDRFKADLKDAAKAEAKQQAKSFGKQIKHTLKALSPAQRDELMHRLMDAAKKGLGHDEPTVQPREPAGMPLSFAQEREWFRDRMFPGIAHNISGALVCEGRLSMPALQGAFDEILRRHEVLRATFHAPAGTPLQTFSAPVSLPIRVVDLSKFSPATRDI